MRMDKTSDIASALSTGRLSTVLVCLAALLAVSTVSAQTKSPKDSRKDPETYSVIPANAVWHDPRVDNRPIAVVMVDFSDATSSKYTRQQVERAFLSPTFPSCADYFSRCTYGRMNLQGSAVFGPLRLRNTLEYYADHHRHAPIKCELLWQDSVDLACETIDLRPFQSIVVLIGETVVYGDNGQGGGRFLLADGTKKEDRYFTFMGERYPVGETLLNPDRYPFQLVAHEVGHSFGLDHALTQTGAHDYFTGMGGSMSDYPNPNPVMGYLPPTMNGWDRLCLGAFQASEIAEIMPGKSATLELAQLNSAATDVKKLARIWKEDGSGFYLVEARWRDDLYDNPEVLPGDGVLVYDVEPTRTGPPSREGAAVVDRISAVLIDPVDNFKVSDPGRHGKGLGSLWEPGMTCVQAAFKVKVLERTPKGYRIHIEP